jgi:cytoskeleton protein RodZ
MSELGRFLGEARTEKKLSLADVEAQTRIRQKYLEALETGDYARLPRGATSRGFLRNYARFLGIDADQATRLYLAESGDKGPELPTIQDGRIVDYRPLEVELHAEPPRSWWPWVVAVVVVALVAAGGWGILNNRITLPQPSGDLWAALGLAPSTATPTFTATPTRWVIQVTPTSPAAPAGLAAQAQPTSDLLPLAIPTVPPTVTPTPRPTATVEVQQQAGLISLKAHIGQPSWIRVIADGQILEEALLNPGIDRTWEATQTLTIRTGNGAGVDLALNGQPLGIMGTVGQVVDKAWTVDQGEVVEVTPTGEPAITPVAKQPVRTPTPTPAG